MIRNIITVAALFAASAALASAATVTTFTDLTTSSTVDGVSYDSSSGTITATTSTDLFTSTGGTSDASYAYYATTLTLALNYSALSSASTSDLISLATVSDGTSTGAIGLALYNGYFAWTWEGAYYADIVTLSSLESSVDENGYLTVTVVINSTEIGNTAGSRFYLADGTTYYSATSLRSGATVYSQIEINSTYVAGVTVTSGSETDSDTIASTSTTLAEATAAVPEPSTFGLLAGIGALALVAARRRRR